MVGRRMSIHHRGIICTSMQVDATLRYRARVRYRAPPPPVGEGSPHPLDRNLIP